MTKIIKDIYFMVEDELPLRPANAKREQMEAVLFELMGEPFMEEYQMLCHDEDIQSRMDLFRYSLALGASLTGSQE